MSFLCRRAKVRYFFFLLFPLWRRLRTIDLSSVRFCHSGSNLWEEKIDRDRERERPIELIASEESLSMKVTVTLRDLPPPSPPPPFPFHSISDIFSLSSSRRGGSKTCYDEKTKNPSNIYFSVNLRDWWEGRGREISVACPSLSLRWNYSILLFLKLSSKELYL